MRFIYIYKTIFLVGLVFYPDSTVFAQTDDTLPQVTVSHYRTQTGVHQQVFDSAQKMRSAGMTMADLLSQSGQAYIKQYGPGNIATANIRGGSSYHTTLLWNGINLINPMLGNSDLSLFPSVFSDISQVQFGTNSSLWGSGNISGSIQTDNPTVFSKHLKISAGIGLTSLNAFNGFAKVQMGNAKKFGSIRVFGSSNQNKFSYYNSYTQSSQAHSHATCGQFAVMGEAGHKFNEKNLVHVLTFINQSNRLIAPLMTETVSKSSQRDINMRLLAYWKHFFSSSVLILRVAAIGDKLIYTDSLRNIYDTSASVYTPVEVEWRKQISKNHSLLFYTGYRPVMARYEWQSEKIIQQNITSLVKWDWQHKNHKFSGNVNARHEYSMNKNPLTFSAETNYHPHKKIQLNVRASTLYRLPTLNDLYWNPGGNKDLLPEQGFAFDGGLRYTCGKKLKTITYDFLAQGRIFYREVKNWIQWVPGTMYWSPQNVAYVQSYGSESTLQLEITRKKTTLLTRVQTLYTVSSPTVGTNQGLQLIYSPMYSGNAHIEIRNKRWWVATTGFYTGYRYTSPDHYQYLEPYITLNTEAGYNFQMSSSVFSVSAGVNNLTDEAFQLVANHPMPGRWYFLRIQYHINR